MTSRDHADPLPTSRRTFLADLTRLAAAGVVSGWMPLGQIAAHAEGAAPAPANFPGGIPLYKQTFRNWSGEIAARRGNGAHGALWQA